MTVRTGWKKYLLLLLLCIALPQLYAASAMRELRKLTPEDFKRLHADSWRVVGKTVVIEGHAYLPVGSMEIFADRIVIDIETRDFEATGDVRIYRWENGSGAVSLERVAQLEQDANVMVRNVTTSLSILGERTYNVDISCKTDQITADRVVGNLSTSYFEFVNPRITYTTFVCKAASGVRTPDGVITLKDAEISSCKYLESDNAHYAIAASEIKLTPHEANFYDLKYADFDPGDRSILLVNGVVKVYDIPILWLPVFFKPKDENPGIAGMQFGKSTHLGFYVNFYKQFVISEDYNLSFKLHADVYEKRGFGYGVSGRMLTAESRTDFMVYSIYDRDPYESDDYDDFRVRVPHGRYSFQLSNVTHLTPRLDFRGSFDLQSDPYFKKDFFESIYEQDPQPATFAALEQQFDRFTVSAYSRFRVNDFFTTVEKLPEVRLDIPRQEIFNTGIYYQGDVDAAYMRMKWIDFDGTKPPKRYSKLRDYDTFRFDTTHFLYYPVANRYFTFVPRAGLRLTAYSHTSKTKVGEDDLKAMFKAAEPQSTGRYTFKNYDSKGGSKLRLAVELGFELSTKIHRTWQDVSSSFWRIDGLRHIIQPYVNYTFIPKPTLDRKRIYFFDDVDRITKQNFFRFGVINRLQTRDNGAIRNLLYMENYWDIHMEKEEGKSAVGNIGTLLSWQIFKGLSLNTEFLIDISGDGEIADTRRHGRNVGKTGLALDWLNFWNINLTYEPAPDWKFSIGYNYVRPYDMHSAYSMGSTLTQINSASYFEQYNDETDEEFYFRFNMPLTPDHRTLGAFNFSYDIPAGSIDEVGLMIIRQFHCWQLVATVGFDREYNDRQWEWEIEYSVSANLTGLNAAMSSVQNTVLRQAENFGANFKF